MKKKDHRPVTRVKNPEPKIEDPDWVIWAAWADRVTFEEIKKRSGNSETDVIKIMRKTLKPSSFRLWRKRVNEKSIKHRKKFEYSRKQISSKIKKDDYV
ncbi:TIGR03643 family protein [Pelagibacterales bacterium SAG-MED09]|nr:TIGR03643 family protein [Pelagibacterales bacterium SAG-MED09]